MTIRRPTGRHAAPSDCCWSPCRRTVTSSLTPNGSPPRWTRSGGSYGQPAECASTPRRRPQLRKEARRALPKMAAAFDDPANHSQGRILARYGRSIGVDLEAPADSMEDLQARLEPDHAVVERPSRSGAAAADARPLRQEPESSRAHHDGQRRPAAARGGVRSAR